MEQLVTIMPQKKSGLEGERITTSIKINPNVWKEFKKYAIDENKEISTILEDMIKEKLGSLPKKR